MIIGLELFITSLLSVPSGTNETLALVSPEIVSGAFELQLQTEGGGCTNETLARAGGSFCSTCCDSTKEAGCSTSPFARERIAFGLPAHLIGAYLHLEVLK
ncbi:MAG: hypothetical protein AAFP89_25705 [Bacteroidota bacterium]